MKIQNDWEVILFSIKGVLYHLCLHHPDVGFGDLSLLGARVIQADDPFFPKGEQEHFSIRVPNPKKMIEFMNLPNLLCEPIIDNERAHVGWHLLPEAPDFILKLRDLRSKDPNDMNCVEWIVYALELGGVDVPMNILTTKRLRAWLKEEKASL